MALFSICFVVLPAACSRHDRANPGILIAPARRGGLEVTVSAPGKVEPARTVIVKSKAAGEIKELLVQEGATVPAGAVLARLDPAVEEARLAQARADFDAATAGVDKARLELEQAEDELRRGQELFQSGFISQAQHETQRRAVSQARSGLVIAQSRQEAAGNALKEAQDRLSYTEIRAPLTGVVLDLAVAPGQVVTSGISGVDSGTELMVMADLSRVQVRAEVDETDVGKVAPGQAVRVEADAFPGLKLSGRVERVSPQAVPKGPVTVVEVEVVLDDPQAAAIRPGMSATVEIITARVEDALLVPVAAVLFRPDPGVVVLKDGATAWRPVKLGVGDWETVAIESGLTAGEEVVLPPGAQLPSAWTAQP